MGDNSLAEPRRNLIKTEGGKHRLKRDIFPSLSRGREDQLSGDSCYNTHMQIHGSKHMVCLRTVNIFLCKYSYSAKLTQLIKLQS